MSDRSNKNACPPGSKRVEVSIRTDSAATITSVSNFIGAGAFEVTTSVRVEATCSKHQCADCKMFKFKCSCKDKQVEKCLNCKKPLPDKEKQFVVKDMVFCSKNCCRNSGHCPDCGDEEDDCPYVNCSCYGEDCWECRNPVRKADCVKVGKDKVFCDYSCASRYHRDEDEEDDDDDEDEKEYRRYYEPRIERCRRCGEDLEHTDRINNMFCSNRCMKYGDDE